MEQSNFEKDIEERKYEADLKRIRGDYFPLIDQKIITGYNLYPANEMFDYSDGDIFLNYLHSDLRPSNKHYQELCGKLKEKGFSLEKRIKVDDELVDREGIIERNADYLIEPEWDNPPNIRYFDFEGNELKLEDAIKLKDNIIGESFQYDMLIRIKDESELRKLVTLFKKYASEFKLDRKGSIVRKNRRRIKNSTKDLVDNAWKVPLLVCTTKNDKKPKCLRDFLVVEQFSIDKQLGEKSAILSMFVRSKSEEFKKILNERGEIPEIHKKYALRVFINEYIDIWK